MQKKNDKRTLPKTKTQKTKTLARVTYEHMKENPWALGLKRQRESDVLLVRLAAKRNNEKKNELRQAIVHSMKVKQLGDNSCKVGMECDHIPAWQQHIRRRSNNLVPR